MQKSHVMRILSIAGIVFGVLLAIVLLLVLRSGMQQQSGGSKSSASATQGTGTPTPSAIAGSSDSISPTPTAIATPYVDPSTIMSGDRGLLVAAVQARLYALGYYAYKPTGYFAGMTLTAVKNFQAANNLHVDGIVSKDTLNILFSNEVKYALTTPVPLPTATPPNVRPREFGQPLLFSKVNTLIPAGSRFLVVDLTSQYYFYAVRQGGTNHMEIVPSSAEDMQRYLAIFSGRSCLDKRPCVIEFNGQHIAASLCGYLHGNENAQAQVLDLYFFGSTASDSNLQDQEHNANLLLSSNGAKPQ